MPRRAGVVHAIGKIVIPDRVLLKRGELTPEERQIIESQDDAGYELLRPIRTFEKKPPEVCTRSA